MEESFLFAHLAQAIAAAKSENDFHYALGLLNMAIFVEAIAPEEAETLQKQFETAYRKSKAE